jgi:hypothetical protein
LGFSFCITMDVINKSEPVKSTIFMLFFIRTG